MSLADLIKIPPIRAFLTDGSVMNVFRAILTKFAVDEGRAMELLDLTDAILDGQIEIRDVPELLVQAFGVEEGRAKRMACDVMGFRLLPLEQYVPGVSQQIQEWGGDLSKYPKSKVGKMRMNGETFASRLDEKLGLEFSEVLIKRCGFLIGAYWRGEKTKESTLTFFSRAQSIGGLGLAPEKAQELLNEVDAEKEMIELDGNAVGNDVVNSGDVAVAEVEGLLGVGEETSSDRGLPLERSQGLSELSEGGEEKGTTVEIAPSHELTSELPIINKPVSVIQSSVAQLAQGVTADRSSEAIAQPTLPADSIKLAKRLSVDVQDVVANIDDAVAIAMNGVRPILVARGIVESVMMDIIRKALKGVRDLYQTRDVLERDLKIVGNDLEVVTEVIEVGYKSVHQNVGQDGQSLRLGKMGNGSLNQNAGQDFAQASRLPNDLPADPRFEAPILPPKKVAPMLTVGSIAPNSSEHVMTDIQPVRKLMGPVDELGGMTPGEFRRLSAVPADAAQKVEDVLATLEAQSYEDRVKGVKAWRNSPVNQLYVLMTSDALQQGVSLAEIATKRRGAGEESLSPAEIRALGALNERLRF